MLSLEKCQTLLSTEYASLSDCEIENMRNEFYRLSELAFDIYRSEVESGSKNPFRLLRE